MKIFGITGGSGVGKTTALSCLAARGGVLIDCDAVYHELLASNRALLDALEKQFPGVVGADGLDRKKLGAIVFRDDAALAQLGRITHRFVREETLHRIARARAEGRPVAAIDAVALFEGGLAPLCDATIAVTAPTALRVRRLVARDGISEDYARMRIAAQQEDERFSQLCGYTLVNDCGSAEEFAIKCNELFDRLLTESNKGESDMENVKDLFFERKNGYDLITPVQEAEMNAYCEAYKKFLDAAKTEREAVTELVRQAEAAGYRPYNGEEPVKAGDKLYRINRGKSVMFVVVGKESMASGANIAAAHIDNPRLDLKPNPLYEDSEMALFQTHYYGGVKKYQWPTIPLALHGVVVRKDGTTVNVCIGEDPTDPVLYITDLLIHLSGEQMKATLADGIKAEALNVLLGTRPLAGYDGKDRVKLAVLKILNEKYGITEADFNCAELTLTPAAKAQDAGLDRSLIGAFGHDDRVCSYAAFYPMLTLENPEKTAVCVLADKEEVGSMGVSGMQSAAFDTLMEDLCDAQGVKLRRCYEKSFCLSADVVNAFDPNYPEPTDKSNSGRVNYGVGIFKYTGSRGKGGSSDASAEVMGKVRAMLERNNVLWQTGELGKVDAGGGGTVAQYIANRNIDTVDAGVPVLSMHAPMELVAKLDCYETMLAMKTLYNEG